MCTEQEANKTTITRKGRVCTHSSEKGKTVEEVVVEEMIRHDDLAASGISIKCEASGILHGVALREACGQGE